jgi:hypothetical protein
MNLLEKSPTYKRKVKTAGDLQTVLSDGVNVRHATIPKGTVCDLVDTIKGQLTGDPLHKLNLYGETLWASDIDIEEI